jgi:hypothetical protein
MIYDYHSDGISYADNTEKISAVRFGVTIPSEVLRKIKVRHYKPDE